MTAEEIRLRALVSLRTGEDLTHSIPPHLQSAGLYPEKIGENEFRKPEFRKKLRAFPDLWDAAVRHGIMVEPEYMLCPYGSIPDMNMRFVAECMLNKPGDEVFGEMAEKTDLVVDLRLIVCRATLAFHSNGVYITDLKFIPKTGGDKVEELLYRGLIKPRPSVTGTIPSKKLRLVHDCKIEGFWFKPTSAIPEPKQDY